MLTRSGTAPAAMLMVLTLCTSTAGVTAAESAPLIERLAIGIVAHDRGPTSDEHESGVDPNIELRLRRPDWAAWRAIGSPAPHIGFTPNFSGDTSALYGGITYDWDFSPSWFVSGSFGIALHDGPLHAADRTRCEENSDCGFGSRVLWRFALEFGYWFTQDQAVTLFYDHISHQGTLADENEGIDHTGLRYQLRF